VLNIKEKTRKTGGGLITGCILLLTGRWVYNWEGLISGGGYKQQFMVCHVLGSVRG